ncbi:hypothetical protein BG004_002554 [Podila humilis]|nr:hypothetical protein BG004_002554 [Podila humilis]
MTEHLEGIPAKLMEDIRKLPVWNTSSLDKRTVDSVAESINNFVVNWANGEAQGSKKRRGHGQSSDDVIFE